jgi:formylglycine-generating enzyme required for sulfatase activity
MDLRLRQGRRWPVILVRVSLGVVFRLTFACALAAVPISLGGGASLSAALANNHTDSRQTDRRAFSPEAFFLPDDSLLGFVRVPAGSFQMGSDPAHDVMAFDNERWGSSGGPRAVDVAEFFIARFEVTTAQFRAFVEQSGFAANGQTLASPGDHPVSFVSWPDALAYTRWLDSRLRQSQSLPARFASLLRDGWRVTLPTEAQWEKAARGSDGRIFPWGNAARGDRANFASRGKSPVGSIACPECAYGLSDLAGNVWEWTRTPYVPGPYSLQDAPPDLESDALWIMRGGSFSDEVRNIRAAVRGGADPGVRRANIGFRLVLVRAL